MKNLQDGTKINIIVHYLLINQCEKFQIYRVLAAAMMACARERLISCRTRLGAMYLYVDRLTTKKKTKLEEHSNMQMEHIGLYKPLDNELPLRPGYSTRLPMAGFLMKKSTSVSGS